MTDPLGNPTTAALVDGYQLAPQRLTDPNGNASEVRYDPLGVVVTTTSYGHVGTQPWGFDALTAVTALEPATLADAVSSPGQYLQGAAGYVWYDLGAWAHDGVPTTVAHLAAEQLLHDGAGGGTAAGSVPAGVSNIQIGVTYLDGFGRQLQAKTLVESGKAIHRDEQGNVVLDAGGRPDLVASTERWRVSGHVVYDAKQHPGRVYEPFFSPSPAYEGDDVLQHIGVSLLKHYDAVGRAVGEDFPDQTFTTTTYRAWNVEHADANDNVLVSGYGALRQGLGASDPRGQAYLEAVRLAGTAVLTYLDPLGRETGSLAKGGTTALDRRTETRLDIDGNAHTIIDPNVLTAFTYRRDMAGRPFYEKSIDAGETWSLHDAYGHLVTTWDGRLFRIDRAYDHGDRPVSTKVNGGDGATPLHDRFIEQWVYGESLGNSGGAKLNVLGRVLTTYDSAGTLSVDGYDPAGRALSSTRRFRSLTDIGTEPD